MSPDQLAKLNKGRMLAATMPALMPLLKQKREDLISKMISSYRGGEKDFLAEVAELAAYYGIEQELLNENKQLQKLEEKLHGSRI